MQFDRLLSQLDARLRFVGFRIDLRRIRERAQMKGQDGKRKRPESAAVRP